MAIALTLQQYLDDQFIDYDVMVHERTSTSSQSATASHVSADCVAKGVVLSREGGFLIAIGAGTAEDQNLRHRHGEKSEKKIDCS